jgi:hypothetical protein
VLECRRSNNANSLQGQRGLVKVDTRHDLAFKLECLRSSAKGSRTLSASLDSRQAAPVRLWSFQEIIKFNSNDVVSRSVRLNNPKLGRMFKEFSPGLSVWLVCFHHDLNALVRSIAERIVTGSGVRKIQAVCDHKGRIDLALLY